MSEDDPHSPEAAIAMAATLLRNAGQPERPEDQAEITLLSLRPGDRLCEGLMVVPEVPTEKMLQAKLPKSPVHNQRYENRVDLRPVIWHAMLTAASEPEDNHE